MSRANPQADLGAETQAFKPSSRLSDMAVFTQAPCVAKTGYRHRPEPIGRSPFLDIDIVRWV